MARIARVELPQTRLKARKRRRRYMLGGSVVLVLCAMWGAVVWLSWAPFLQIHTVEVSGAETVASSTIVDYARAHMNGTYLYMFSRTNIFLYPRAAIAAGLRAQYPVFRDIDVHAKDFHTVAVVVAERQPSAVWCPSAGSGQADSCYYMDEQGLVYAPAASFEGASPYVTYHGALATTTSEPWPRQYLTPDEFQSLSALVQALMLKEPDNPVRDVAVDSSGDVRAYFQQDFMLLFTTRDNGGDVFERFELALDADPFKGKTLSQFEYLDLRFGDKLYYKAK